MTPADITQITESFKAAKSRILFLDYDGTLAPITPISNDSHPVMGSLAIIDRLCQKSKIVIVSGRSRNFLKDRFRNVRVDLAAEFGAAVRKNKSWEIHAAIEMDWKPDVARFIAGTTFQHAFIEEKEFGIVVHFPVEYYGRNIPRFGLLKQELEKIVQNCSIEVTESPGSIELKPCNINKGAAVELWVSAHDYDFILAAGDHDQDECMFIKLPKKAFTVKVGLTKTAARYNVISHYQIIELLEFLSN